MRTALRTLLLISAVLVVIAVLAGAGHAKKGAKLYSMTVVDVNNVETRMEKVKVFLLEEAFGEEVPRKKGIEAIKGNRGEGALEVKVTDISELTVEPVKEPDQATGQQGGLKLTIRLWNGEYTPLSMAPQDSNVVFEGKSALGAFSIGLRSIRKVVVRRQTAR